MKRKIIFHISFWLILMLSFAISEWSYRNTFIDALTVELLFLPARLLMVYINWFLLIPKFLFKNKPYKYATLLVVLLFFVGFIQRAFVLYIGYPIFFPEWMEGEHIHLLKLTRIIQNVMIIVIPVAFTSGWVLFTDLKKKQEQTRVLEQQKTDSELKYLKSQINPHFLFNTLNTIYGLSMEGSKKTSELILKLSDFLSFSLYESNQNLIPLEKEIALMNDFIALEKSRFDDRIKISIDLPKSNTIPIVIPPLILVPFVENAFKHSLKNETQMAQINIRLSVNVDLIIFIVENSKPSDPSISPNTNKGFGLNNIKKRLKIIYGEKFSLNIKDTDVNYLIELNIRLT